MLLSLCKGLLVSLFWFAWLAVVLNMLKVNIVLCLCTAWTLSVGQIASKRSALVRKFISTANRDYLQVTCCTILQEAWTDGIGFDRNI